MSEHNYSKAELMTAASKADAAGDEDGARRLVQMAQQVNDVPQRAAPAPAAPVDNRSQSVGNVAMEGVTAVNRIGAAGLDVVTSPLQFLLQATGVDIPSFSSGVPEKGAYAGEGLGTEAVNDAVEFASWAVPIGAGMRASSKALQQATMLGEGTVKKILTSMGQTTVRKDVTGGAISGVAGVGTGEVAAQLGGEEWRGTGEFIGQIVSPAAWNLATDKIVQSVVTAAPTTAHLRGASKALYSLLDDANLTANADSVASMSAKLTAFTADNGLTAAAPSGAIGSRLARMQKELDAGRMTYSMLDEIGTKFRSDAAGANDSAARLAGDAADMIDNMIYKMVPNNPTDFVVGAAGTTATSTAAGGQSAKLGGRQVMDVLDDARDFWRRASVSQTLEEAADTAARNASASRSNFTTTYRRELNKLLDPSSEAGQYMTKAERTALRKVIDGGTGEKMMEGVANAFGINSNDYVKSLVASLLIGGAGYGGGATSAGIMGGGLLTAAAIGKGLGARANAIFKNNANMLRGNIAAGNKAKEIIANYNRYTQPNMRNSEDLATLLIQGNADLNTLPSNLGRIPWLADSVWMANVARTVMAEDQQTPD
jgi:hypothetical protein